MSFLQDRRIRKLAEDDTTVGVSQARDRIQAEIGVPPDFDIERFPQHGFEQDDLEKEQLVEEYHAATVGDSVDDPPAPKWVLVLGAAAAIVVGGIASIMLMESIGMASPQRFYVGLGLEAILIILTARVHDAFLGFLNPATAVGVTVSWVALLVFIATLRLFEIEDPDVGSAS